MHKSTKSENMNLKKFEFVTKCKLKIVNKHFVLMCKQKSRRWTKTMSLIGFKEIAEPKPLHSLRLLKYYCKINIAEVSITLRLTQ